MNPKIKDESETAAEQAAAVWALFAPAILEDWFAGIALKELMRTQGADLYGNLPRSAQQNAEAAYDISQAMLAEKRKRQAHASGKPKFPDNATVKGLR